jgi:predicted phage terminase large subunit-like protein
MATASNAVTVGTGDYPEPYHEQIPFMGTDRRFYGFISGTGAGKTFAGVYRLLVNATLWNPDSMGAIIVPDKSQFTDNVKPIMEDFGIMDRWEYKSVYTDEPGLVTANGQRILILSADNQRQIGRIKGKNLAYVWMDEEAEIDPRAREIAQQRLRVGQYPNLFITTTPDGYNHTYDFFKGDVNPAERPHGEATLYETDDRVAIVGVPPEANPVMREEDIASMRKSLPEEIVAQEIEGEFIEIGAGIFKRDMIQFVRPNALSEDKRYNYHLAVDPAVQADTGTAQETDSDYWAATLGAVDQLSKQLYALDCTRERGMSLREGVNWIQRIGGEQSDRIYVEANQSQRWLKQELQDAGLNAVPIQSYRDKEERIIDLSVPIERGDVVFVNRDIDDQLGYDPRWQDLIQEMLAFPEGSHDDMVDSLHLLIDNCELGSATSILGADPRARED